MCNNIERIRYSLYDFMERHLKKQTSLLNIFIRFANFQWHPDEFRAYRRINENKKTMQNVSLELFSRGAKPILCSCFAQFVIVEQNTSGLKHSLKKK